MSTAFLTGDVTKGAVGFRVRLVRKMVGDTQEAFAPKIGMRHKGYQSVENGKAYLRSVHAKRIFDLWGVDANFIYFGEFAHLSVKLAGNL